MPTIERLQDTTCVLSCFDRVIFHGHLTRLTSARGVAGLAVRLGVRVAVLAQALGGWRQRLIDHAVAMAKRRSRPVLRLAGHERKEDRVRQLLQMSPVRRGLVCVVIVQEPFWSFRFAGRQEAPRIEPDRRRGTTIYYYLLDPLFGLMHVRVNSFIPYTAQIYLNGHEWLAGQLRRARIRFCKQDNVFTSVSQIRRAQEIADGFIRLGWVRLFDRLAHQVNPLLLGPLCAERYYWCVDQAEYATDVLFPNAAALQPLWERLRLAVITGLRGDDVMSFFGRSPQQSRFEVVGDSRHRWQGFRIKHRLGRNTIKCYDKAGSVLRIETTINNPADFQLYRQDARRWEPVRKGVADFFRVEQIARRANQRYLAALAALDLPPSDGLALLRLQQPVTRRGRRAPGLRLLADDTLALFQALTDGRVHLRGLTNTDLRRTLYGAPHPDPVQERRRAQRLTRQLAQLRDHGLIRKLPRTRRWTPTAAGLRLIPQALALRDSLWPQALPAAA